MNPQKVMTECGLTKLFSVFQLNVLVLQPAPFFYLKLDLINPLHFNFLGPTDTPR